jgi:hypothetical protein
VEISESDWSEADWAEHESDDWWQTEELCGGYDATESAFCFSYYAPEGDEFWFQFTLAQAAKIANGEITTITARFSESE